MSRILDTSNLLDKGPLFKLVNNFYLFFEVIERNGEVSAMIQSLGIWWGKEIQDKEKWQIGIIAWHGINYWIFYNLNLEEECNKFSYLAHSTFTLFDIVSLVIFI